MYSVKYKEVSAMKYPVIRDMDGVYFRVERKGRYENICFSDMTEEEIEKIIGDRPAEWWKSLALHLKSCLNQISEQFDIRG